MTPLLEVLDLRKHFPIQKHGVRPAGMLHAVDGVSFALTQGEALGLVGETGCGKSTLAQVIVRLLDQSSGRILFDGREIGAIPSNDFYSMPDRTQIQMVFQDATDSLNPRHTAFDSIADPLWHLKKLRGRELRDRVMKAAELVNLPEDLLSRFPHQLSGGQKTRVGIARAVGIEPKLIVLDEPTSALDVSIQAVILKLLEDLRQRLNLSYIFVSHDLNVVRMLCERVLVMYMGNVVETGRTVDVFHHPRHPYTSALINAIPSIKNRSLPTPLRLSGEPMSPIDPTPNQCRFYSRCPKRRDLCLTTSPPIVEDNGWITMCHFPTSIDQGSQQFSAEVFAP